MRAARRSAVALVVLLVAACAARGPDAGLLYAEDVLKVSPAVYDAAMTFAEQNQSRLPLETLRVFEAARVNFPPAYRVLDSGVQAYKAGKTNDMMTAASEVNRIVVQIATLVAVNGGPKLALPGGGGR